eukprot:NODE_17401_length_944_cov_5.709914.p1 GENE.NODE_17401_length_944_cov_5.709914~~NODE_17401_length_944_cov_5.709914.p1  ORF type:complete len:177 (+),score=49.30 NODE_17401_length_944_cov_5.709914:98-628(+)
MAVHPGYICETAVIDAPIDFVWRQVSAMNFKFTRTVAQCKRVEGEDHGYFPLFTIAYADHTIQTVRLTELSERLPGKRSLGFELIASEPCVTYSAAMHQIVLTAVTHSAGPPRTFVEFSTDFSSDADLAVIEDSRFKKKDFLDHLNEACSGAPMRATGKEAAEAEVAPAEAAAPPA